MSKVCDDLAQRLNAVLFGTAEEAATASATLERDARLAALLVQAVAERLEEAERAVGAQWRALLRQRTVLGLACRGLAAGDAQVRSAALRLALQGAALGKAFEAMADAAELGVALGLWPDRDAAARYLDVIERGEESVSTSLWRFRLQREAESAAE